MKKGEFIKLKTVENKQLFQIIGINFCNFYPIIIRAIFIILIFFLGIFRLFSQIEYSIYKQGKLTQNSRLEFKYLSLYDSKKDSFLFPLEARYGTTKWFKMNDSTFLIEIHAYLPFIDKYLWKEILVAKINLIVSSDTFNLSLDTSYVGYPIMTKKDIKSIKKQIKHPGKLYAFSKLSDYKHEENGIDEIDSFTRTCGLTAIAIMNGHNELLDSFNDFQFSPLCIGQSYEIYCDIQFILSFFGYKICKGKDHVRYLIH